MDEVKTVTKDVTELWSRIDKRTLTLLDSNEQELCIGFMITGYIAGLRRANGIDDIFAAGPLKRPPE